MFLIIGNYQNIAYYLNYSSWLLSLSLCECAYMSHVLWYTFGAQRTICESQFSPSTTWVPDLNSGQQAQQQVLSPDYTSHQFTVTYRDHPHSTDKSIQAPKTPKTCDRATLLYLQHNWAIKHSTPVHSHSSEGVEVWDKINTTSIHHSILV